jgi:hypothetical protein
VRSKMSGCCCLNETGNKILLKISWRWVNQGFQAAFLRGFSTSTITILGQKQTLMLHLFTPTSEMLCGQLLGRHCAQLCDLVFIVTPSAQCTDLRGVSIGNVTIIAGGNPVNTQEKHVLLARRYCGSFLTSGLRRYHYHLRRSLGWMRQASGLAS